LGMSAKEARNKTNEEIGLRAPFDYRGIDSHSFLQCCSQTIIGLPVAHGNSQSFPMTHEPEAGLWLDFHQLVLSCIIKC
jgi:hypothetical protein